MRNMVNNDRKALTQKDREIKIAIQGYTENRIKRENKKLRQEIMTDIRK